MANRVTSGGDREVSGTPAGALHESMWDGGEYCSPGPALADPTIPNEVEGKS
jgi:hypothetical protein